MKVAITVPLILIVFSVFAFGQGQQAEKDTEQFAVEAAEAWLNLVDGGEYPESWDEAARYFKTVVNKEQWQESLIAIRTPLGKVVSRKLVSAQYTTSLPGTPDGEYVVVQYETSFENKKSAIETVTPILNKDGEWRVSGYYIR